MAAGGSGGGKEAAPPRRLPVHGHDDAASFREQLLGATKEDDFLELVNVTTKT